MHLVICLQGGGVYINGGTVNIQDLSIHNNQVGQVSASRLKPSHRPDGVLNARRTYTISPDGVLAFADIHTCHSPVLAERKLIAIYLMEPSHRPDVVLALYAFGCLFAGGRCLHRRWHSEHPRLKYPRQSS